MTPGDHPQRGHTGEGGHPGLVTRQRTKARGIAAQKPYCWTGCRGAEGAGAAELTRRPLHSHCHFTAIGLPRQ